jgi:predicted ArsR family transcriptional regulator
MTPANEANQWQGDRTTFQRVYDVLIATRKFLTAADFAERADCSENGARRALEQLAEMGIASRQEGRPARYRRNDSYFTWRRVESLAREHTAAELRERIAGLIQDDEAFQEQYGVPEPDAVSTDELPIDDHEALEERWEDLQEWRTVRRDIRLLRRAVQRVESPVDDTALA